MVRSAWIPVYGAGDRADEVAVLDFAGVGVVEGDAERFSGGDSASTFLRHDSIDGIERIVSPVYIGSGTSPVFNRYVPDAHVPQV